MNKKKSAREAFWEVARALDQPGVDMSNIVQFPKKSTFDAEVATLAARYFDGGKARALELLARSTSPTGQISITNRELGRRMNRSLNTTKIYLQELVRHGVLQRELRNGVPSEDLKWNMEVASNLAAEVHAADVAAGVTHQGIIPPTSKTGQVLSLYLTAERELRRSGQLGAPSSALTARPGEEGQRWLEQWTIDFAADHGVEVERVPRGAWLAFRSFRSNDNGSISYSQRAWPFSFLPGEIRWNPPRFETRVRKRLGIEERTIDVPLFSGRDVPQHFAAAGGAS